MKKFTIIAVLLLVLSWLMFTGFQCSSAEITSAKLYEKNQDWASAEKSYMKEVEKNPTNGEGWFRLGRVRAQRGNFKGMVEAFDKSLANTKEFEKDISDVKKFAWGQSLNLAVNLYNKSLSTSKDTAATLREKAIENYKVALLINQDSAITYQHLAIAQHVQGYYDDEISTLKEGLKHKSTVAIHTALINVYLKKAQDAEAKGSKPEAAENYNNSINAIMEIRKIQPDDVELLGTMIDIYVRIGKANEAKPYIREAIEKDPSNKVYQFNLGVLLLQTDSLEESVPYFDAALKTDPNYSVALQNIAVAHIRIGDKLKQKTQTADAKANADKTYLEYFKKAVEYAKRLTEIRKDDDKAWDLLATACANANLIKEAKDALEKADSLRKK